MPELRKDPVSGRWVIVATERAKRPTDFHTVKEETKEGSFCPFCPGNESKTPPEVLSYRSEGTEPDTEGWWLRVIPNKYPALRIEEDTQRSGEGMYDKMKGVGAHEVIIETPDHNISLADMPTQQICEVIWAYRDRVVELKNDPRFRYIFIFKNKGPEAGASLAHSHSQLIALPIVPKRVQEELAGAYRYWDYKERCVFCDIIRQEQKDKRRIIFENDDFICVMPFASRFPFETWILPKKHLPFFHAIEKDEVHNLALCMSKALWKIKEALNDPSYNYVLHTTPFGYERPFSFHWHIEIIPKLTKIAGFEWGTGFYINPTPPEEAAKYLRKLNHYPQPDFVTTGSH